MDENHVRIVQVADELFNTRGYRHVTISDLADRLGMSKKTVYVYFESKEDIAAAVVDRTMQRIVGAIEQVRADANPLATLREILEAVKEEVVHLRPIFLEDIQKVLPDLWDAIVAFRAEKIVRLLGRFIEEAQQEGLAKPLNPRLTSLIFIEAVQALIEPNSLSQHGFSVEDIVDTLIELFLSGIALAESGHPR